VTFYNNQYPPDIGATLVGASPQMISNTLTDPFGNNSYFYSTAGSFYLIASRGTTTTAMSGVSVYASATCTSASGVLLNTYTGVICKTNSNGNGCNICSQ